MKILCVLGEHNYGDPQRGGGYEYVNFLPALRNLGHEVVFFESYNKTAYADFADLNRSLLETVVQEDPDVIFFVLFGYEVWLETLALLRKKSRAVLINWATDDSWKYAQFSRFFAPRFDIYVTTYPHAKKQAEANCMTHVVLSQWAANSDALVAPIPAAQCRYDVTFVGTSYGNRPQWIADLAARGIDVTCYGKGWKNGVVSSLEMQRIIRESRLTLNFGDSGLVFRGLIPTKSRQIKARIFEVPGAGGFLMTEGAERLEQFFDVNREIAIFSDLDDLASQIRHLLLHPEVRDEIAIAGYERVVAEHTYEVRFSGLMDKAVSLLAHRATMRLTSEDLAHFDSCVMAHRHVGPGLRLLRSSLIFLFLPFFGVTRAERAARRLLLEISWRLCGATTYSASGLPGRLFYRAS